MSCAAVHICGVGKRVCVDGRAVRIYVALRSVFALTGVRVQARLDNGSAVSDRVRSAALDSHRVETLQLQVTHERQRGDLLGLQRDKEKQMAQTIEARNTELQAQVCHASLHVQMFHVDGGHVGVCPQCVGSDGASVAGNARAVW